jgi:hypothetical protein
MRQVRILALLGALSAGCGPELSYRSSADVSQAGAPDADSGSGLPDSGFEVRDARAPEPDATPGAFDSGTVSVYDAAIGEWDAAGGPDAGPAGSDAAAHPDAAEPDAAAGEPDSATGEPDAAAAGRDAAAAGADAAAAGRDAAAAGRDATPMGPDVGAGLDAGLTCTGDEQCADGNPCTDDSCVSGACVHVARNQGPCEDGDLCTTNDTCVNGVCVPGPQLFCGASSACLTVSCDPAFGCRQVSNCPGAHQQCIEGNCRCQAGYVANGQQCDDVDECALSPSPCDAHATCANLPGSFTCTCNPGWEGNGLTCTPIPVCGDGTCARSENWASCPQDCPYDVTVVVESSLMSSLTTSLAQYSADLVSDGYQSNVVSWTGGTLADLKTLLRSQATAGSKGAFLIGNLPTAWYQQVAFGTAESFPCDLFLSAPDATWSDSNSDGIFDGHTPQQMTASFFVSRLIGSASDLQAYFARNHSYRTLGYLEDASAYIFIDDSWVNFGLGDSAGLGALFTQVDKVEDVSLTTRANYVSKLTGAGAAVVHQYIHANPNYLQITGTGGGTITTGDVESNDFKGSFYNLFDCSAARYTQTNLAMTYLLRTTYGLAVLGSTKTGGVASPQAFDSALASGKTWGEAYEDWYNQQGKWDDQWYLGIVILGDPMLVLHSASGAGSPPAPGAGALPHREELEAIMRESARTIDVRDFEDYRRSNPQFFRQ